VQVTLDQTGRRWRVAPPIFLQFRDLEAQPVERFPQRLDVPGLQTRSEEVSTWAAAHDLI